MSRFQPIGRGSRPNTTKITQGKCTRYRISTEIRLQFQTAIIYAFHQSMPIHVTLDTSVLRSENVIRGPRFTLLRHLVQSGLAILYLSEIVIREYVTAKEDELRDHLQRVSKALRDFPLSFISVEDASELKLIQHKFLSLRDRSKDAFSQIFQNWLLELVCEVLPIEAEDAPAVFNSYFTGASPYKGAKSREDIPDAFIAEAVQRLAREEQTLHLVCGDNTLRKHFGATGNIKIFSSLKDFLFDPEIRPHVANALLAAHFDGIVQFLQGKVGDLTSELIECITHELLLREVRTSDPDAVDDRGWISHVDEFSKIALQIERAEYVGENFILIPFSARASVAVSYNIFRQDENSNDDFELVDTEDEFDLDGTLSLSLKIKGQEDGVPFLVAQAIEGWEIELDDLEIRGRRR